MRTLDIFEVKAILLDDCSFVSRASTNFYRARKLQTFEKEIQELATGRIRVFENTRPNCERRKLEYRYEYETKREGERIS